MSSCAEMLSTYDWESTEDRSLLQMSVSLHWTIQVLEMLLYCSMFDPPPCITLHVNEISLVTMEVEVMTSERHDVTSVSSFIKNAKVVCDTFMSIYW